MMRIFHIIAYILFISFVSMTVWEDVRNEVKCTDMDVRETLDDILNDIPEKVQLQDAMSDLDDAMSDLVEVKCTDMVVRETLDDILNDIPEKVQLWEGGPYWATKNIGAEKPEDYGYYFWWGDTVGYKRENDRWVASNGSNSNFSFRDRNIPTCNKSISRLKSEGWITSDGVLALEHDAAHIHLGGYWRMPTEQEIVDLNDKCNWTWTTMNGVRGYVVRGLGEYASNSIFLPCAGYGYETLLDDSGSSGRYWSSVPYSGYNDAWFLFFYSGYHSTGDLNRCRGLSVRPVQGFTK